MASDIEKLVVLGMPPEMAKQVVLQTTSAVGSGDPLCRVGMAPVLAKEVSSSITSGRLIAKNLINRGMAPELAKAMTMLDLNWWKTAKYKAIDIADSVAKSPAAAIDFRLDREALTTVAAGSIAGATTAQLTAPATDTFANCFTFTRASTGTFVDINGVTQTAAVNVPRYSYANGVRQLLIEGASTNLFLNSAVGVTQNITTTAQAYTVSFEGTGSITLSGTATGTLNGTGANNRVSLTVTATAGTLTCTVSGSCTSVQVEALSVASSFIPTDGATVTRAADVCLFSAKMLALINRGDVTIVLRGRTRGLQPGGALIISNNGDIIRQSSGTPATLVAGVQFSPTLTGMGVNNVFPGPFGAAYSYASAFRGVSGNGSTIATDANTNAGGLTAASLGNGAGGTAGYFWVDELVIYPFRATNAEVVRLASVYA